MELQVDEIIRAKAEIKQMHPLADVPLTEILRHPFTLERQFARRHVISRFSSLKALAIRGLKKTASYISFQN
jgi:hypothetical protein